MKWCKNSDEATKICTYLHLNGSKVWFYLEYSVGTENKPRFQFFKLDKTVLGDSFILRANIPLFPRILFASVTVVNIIIFVKVKTIIKAELKSDDYEKLEFFFVELDKSTHTYHVRTISRNFGFFFKLQQAFFSIHSTSLIFFIFTQISVELIQKSYFHTSKNRNEPTKKIVSKSVQK